MWQKILKFLCMIGIHDLEIFHPEWIDHLPTTLYGMHWNYVCRRCGRGF